MQTRGRELSPLYIDNVKMKVELLHTNERQKWSFLFQPTLQFPSDERLTKGRYDEHNFPFLYNQLVSSKLEKWLFSEKHIPLSPYSRTNQDFHNLLYDPFKFLMDKDKLSINQFTVSTSQLQPDKSTVHSLMHVDDDSLVSHRLMTFCFETKAKEFIKPDNWVITGALLLYIDKNDPQLSLRSVIKVFDNDSTYYNQILRLHERKND